MGVGYLSEAPTVAFFNTFVVEDGLEGLPLLLVKWLLPCLKIKNSMSAILPHSAPSWILS